MNASVCDVCIAWRVVRSDDRLMALAVVPRRTWPQLHPASQALTIHAGNFYIQLLSPTAFTKLTYFHQTCGAALMTDFSMRQREFRPELQGMRGLDALCIAAGHIWTPAATGGVGMFYCLSGMLVIARMHFEATENHAASKCGAAFGVLLRSLERILPEALAVIAFTVVGCITCMPALTQSTLAEAASAASFTINWRFKAQSTIYSARDSESSPLLVFWSLAVIVQVYVANAVFYWLVVNVFERSYWALAHGLACIECSINALLSCKLAPWASQRDMRFAPLPLLALWHGREITSTPSHGYGCFHSAPWWVVCYRPSP